jgi:hypothetical protein
MGVEGLIARSGTLAAKEVLMRPLLGELLYFDYLYTADNGFRQMLQMARAVESSSSPIQDPALV